jgi:dihydroorotase
VFIGSSTGAIGRGRRSLRRIFAVIRRRARLHAEDEYRSTAQAAPHRGDPRSHRYGATRPAALTATRRLVKLARERGASMCAYLDKQEIGFFGITRTSRPARRRRNIIGRARIYERLNTRAQMNPPVRSADHRDGIWYGIEAGHHRRARLRPRAATEEKAVYPPLTLRHDRGADLVPVMLDRQRQALIAGSLRDLTSAGLPGSYNIACRAASRPLRLAW